MIATTIEQGKRLQAVIGTKDCDMVWALPFAIAPDGQEIPPQLFVEPYCDMDIAPAWSLGALVELCPPRAFDRIARARGADVEGIFEDVVSLLTRPL